MKKITRVEQRNLKSKRGKERKGIFKFTKEITNFSTGKEEAPEVIKAHIQATLGIHKSREDVIMDYICEQEELAKRVIRKAGLDPDDNDTIFTLDDGTRCNYDGAIARRKHEREPEGYADDMLFNIRRLRAEIANNNLFEALFFAVEMERSYGDLDLAQHELERIIGIDFLNQAGEGGKYTDEDKECWRSIYDDVTADGQNKSKTWIRDRIIKRLGLPVKAGRSVYDWIGEQQRQDAR